MRGERGMRTAVLYDVHGNLDALDAVLAEVEAADVDRVLAGGDYVLNGPQPAECVDRLRALGDRLVAIQGNTDRWIVEGRDDAGVRWTTERIGPERVAWLTGLPTRASLPEHAALALHATARSDEEMLLPETPAADVRPMLEGIGEAVVLVGHVHVQFERELDPWLVVNPGSVGFPSDGGQTAAWALLEGSRRSLRRTAYGWETTVERLRRSDNPSRDRSIWRLRTAARP